MSPLRLCVSGNSLEMSTLPQNSKSLSTNCNFITLFIHSDTQVSNCTVFCFVAVHLLFHLYCVFLTRECACHVLVNPQTVQFCTLNDLERSITLTYPVERCILKGTKDGITSATVKSTLWHQIGEVYLLNWQLSVNGKANI